MSYTGQFATNCEIPSDITGAAVNSMARSRHFARSAVSSIQVAFANWVIDWNHSSWVEAGSGAAMTLTAAIEYGGVSTAFRWSGSSSVVIADGSTSALSDPLSISIPSGNSFFIRSFYTIAGGAVIFNTGTGVSASTSGADNANGEDFSTNTTDQTTATGLITGGVNHPGLLYRPVLLVATLPSTQKSFLLIGDSRSLGYRDAYTGTSNDRGQLSRVTGVFHGYINCGIPSDATSNFISSHAKRVALAAYVSHVLCEYGIVDLASISAAALATNLATIYAYFSVPVYQTTINPRTTSSDAWATTVNQTLDGPSNGPRITFNNTYVRPVNIAGMTGYLEVSDVLESARDSGLWAVNGSANWYTDDGIHETNTANLAIQSALITNSLFAADPPESAITSYLRSRHRGRRG